MQSYLKMELVVGMDYWALNGSVNGRALSGACFFLCCQYWSMGLRVYPAL